jgi:hypothetical protein
MSKEWTLIAKRITKIGVRQLWRDGDRWKVTLDNRTYNSSFDIPPDKVEVWKKEFGV